MLKSLLDWLLLELVGCLGYVAICRPFTGSRWLGLHKIDRGSRGCNSLDLAPCRSAGADLQHAINSQPRERAQMCCAAGIVSKIFDIHDCAAHA